MKLAQGKENSNIAFDPDIMRAVLRRLYNTGRVTPQMLTTPECKALINETYKVLNGAIGQSITQETPAELTHALRENAFIFSGFKAYHNLREIGLSLTEEDGTLKPFAKFAEDVKGIDARYNQRYLYAEYNHAVHTSQMAVKWNDFTKDGDEYNLQYRTAGDERVRSDHARLDGVTLPPSDKFWNNYLPPNGWNCRCQVVQVLKDDYPVSDSDAATQWGDECTEDPKAQIFRYNAGKEMEIFPPRHPYFKAPAVVKKVVEKLADEEMKPEDDNLTTEQRKAIEENCKELEKALGIKRGKAMSVEDADKQSANPKFIPEFIKDPNGVYRDRKTGEKFSKNPKYSGANKRYHINCATCTPAYALRRRGLDVKAKGRVDKKGRGTHNDWVAYGHSYDIWKNADGSAAKPTLLQDYITANKLPGVSKDNYKNFLEESTKDPGIYVLLITWQSGGGHATVLERKKDGSLVHVEPQEYNPDKGIERSIDGLCERVSARARSKDGVMRIDDKVFDTAYADLFDVK